MHSAACALNAATERTALVMSAPKRCFVMVFLPFDMAVGPAHALNKRRQPDTNLSLLENLPDAMSADRRQ
jgi:hypothetical protein